MQTRLKAVRLSDLGSRGTGWLRAEVTRAGQRGVRPAATTAPWLQEVAALGSASSRLQATIGMALESGPWVAGSVTMVQSGRMQTVAYLDARAAECDRRQQETGEGPAFDAVSIGQVQTATDLSVESRWPAWSPAVVGLGIHRALTVQLFVDRTLGTINLYATRPGEIPDAAIRLTQEVAAYASVLLASAITEGQLRQAISTRGLIGQAQGILMHTYGIDAARAFDVLRSTSQQHNVKLVVVAEQLVSTGTFSDLTITDAQSMNPAGRQGPSRGNRPHLSRTGK